MGKRGPKKGQGGRPKGSGRGKYAGKPAKSPPEIRAYWRQQYYAKKQPSLAETVLSSKPSVDVLNSKPSVDVFGEPKKEKHRKKKR